MKKGTFLGAVLGLAAGAVTGGIVVGKLESNVLQEKMKKVDKFKGYYNLLNQWLALKQEGKSFETYFKDNGIKKIAIYGMGEIGARLYYELRESGIELCYAIDNNALSAYSELEIYNLEDELPDVEMIIVTAIFDFDEIKNSLQEKVNSRIISLEEIVYEI